jgi:hypothetical protein
VIEGLRTSSMTEARAAGGQGRAAGGVTSFLQTTFSGCEHVSGEILFASGKAGETTP